MNSCIAHEWRCRTRMPSATKTSIRCTKSLGGIGQVTSREFLDNRCLK